MNLLWIILGGCCLGIGWLAGERLYKAHQEHKRLRVPERNYLLEPGWEQVGQDEIPATLSQMADDLADRGAQVSFRPVTDPDELAQLNEAMEQGGGVPVTDPVILALLHRTMTGEGAVHVEVVRCDDGECLAFYMSDAEERNHWQFLQDARNLGWLIVADEEEDHAGTQIWTALCPLHSHGEGHTPLVP